MRDERVVDAYLENIAGGQTEYLSDLLLQLSDEILFTPVLSISNPDNAAGANVIKVATFSSAGRRIVPTFTSEENFIEWSAGKHQCFSVAGADLAISLPPNTWLVINPGKPASCELSPEQVAVVAASDRCADFDATRDTSEPEDDDARRATRTDLKSVVVAEAPLSGPEAEADISASEASFSFVAQEVCNELEQVLRTFGEVAEGYYQETVSGCAQGVLGLLAGNISAEKRFHLIDQIAEVSRKYYGSAGAIEVYDDLNLKTSSSWELFKTLAPFYTREKSLLAAPVKSELRSNLVIERVRRDRVYSNFEPGEEEAGSSPASSWHEIRKTGSKLLNVFRLGSRTEQ